MDEIEELRTELLMYAKLPPDGGKTVRGINAVCAMALRARTAEPPPAQDKLPEDVRAILTEAIEREGAWESNFKDKARALLERLAAPGGRGS